MITVRNSTDTADIVLPAVDHVTGAEEAAKFLWDSVFEHAKVHGGAAFLDSPDDRPRDDGGWGVRWVGGPEQWADAYVVGEGADAMGFVAETADSTTVVFRDTD